MRESPEAVNDVVVALCVGQARLSQASGELGGSLLIGELFRMAEREIEKELQIGRSFEIVTSVDRGPRNAKRQGVGVVHTPRAAKGIARELIEEN